jgi:hypothetical protein
MKTMFPPQTSGRWRFIRPRPFFQVWIGIPPQAGPNAARPALPMALAFDVADLVLTIGWASFHDARMTIRLDDGSG